MCTMSFCSYNKPSMKWRLRFAINRKITLQMQMEESSGVTRPHESAIVAISSFSSGVSESAEDFGALLESAAWTNVANAWHDDLVAASDCANTDAHTMFLHAFKP